MVVARSNPPESGVHAYHTFAIYYIIPPISHLVVAISRLVVLSLLFGVIS